MSSRGLERSVNLNQDKPCLVICLLYDIKASNAGLSDALRSVFKRCSTKRFHVIRFDMHVNMDNKHSEHAVL